MTKVGCKIFVLMIFVFQISFGQKELFGTWKVNCPMEKVDVASVKYCGLCPTSQKDKSSITVNEFEMEIDQIEIKLIMNNVKTAVQYKWNEDIYTIEFNFKEIKYKFKVLWTNEDNMRILKTDDGQLMVLRKR